MTNFNYFDNISDCSAIVLQQPENSSPNFLKENQSWQSLNITLDSESFHQGMSYHDFVSKYVHKDIFNNEQNKPILEKILSCARSILEKLKTLEEVGIRISLFVAGGCIREIINKKAYLVKDFDFFVSFYPDSKEISLSKENFLDNNKIKELQQKYPDHIFFKCMENYTTGSFYSDREQSNNKIISDKLSVSDLSILNNIIEDSHIWSTTENNSWYLHMVNLAELLLQEFQPKLYSKSTIIVDNVPYQNLIDDHSLVGVIKLKTLEFPCDIMFIENSTAFFAQFDWEICKAGLTLYNPEPPKKMVIGLSKTFNCEIIETTAPLESVPFFNSLPTSAENCVSRFFSIGKFFEDIARKQLTYKVYYNPTHILQNEMSKRRKRLKEKYPDFKVVWDTQFLYNKKNKEEDLKNEKEILTINALMEEAILEDFIPVKKEVKSKPFKL